MSSKQLFKMMKRATRMHLLIVNAYILNMSNTANEAVKALQLQLNLTTTRYATFLKVLQGANAKTVKFLASAYNYADDTLINYLRGEKND